MKKILFIVSLFCFAVLSQFEGKAQTDTTFSVTTSANPFDEQVVINVNQGNKNVTGIKVFDAIGKDVTGEIKITIINKVGIVSFALDFAAMRPGVYFCTIYTDKGIIETRKLFRAAR